MPDRMFQSTRRWHRLRLAGGRLLLPGALAVLALLTALEVRAAVPFGDWLSELR